MIFKCIPVKYFSKFRPCSNNARASAIYCYFVSTLKNIKFINSIRNINFQKCFWTYSQRHESQCMYRSNKCNYCKQWVIWNGHEDNCEEIPEACRLCYKLVRRKNLEVILDLCLHFLFIQFSSEPVMKGHVLYVVNAWVFVREKKSAHCWRTRGYLNRPEDSSFRKGNIY